MMPSFISMITLMIFVMIYGKSRRKSPGIFVVVIIAALIQTAVTLYDFHTMEIPTP